MMPARNVILSGAYEGYRIKVLGNVAQIGRQVKEDIPLDQTTMESYQVLGTERVRDLWRFVLPPIVMGLFLSLAGCFLTLPFLDSGSLYVFLLPISFFCFGAIGSFRGLWKARSHQVTLRFQDGRRSEAEVDQNVLRALASCLEQRDEFPDTRPEGRAPTPDGILAEINRVNDAIRGERMSRQIDHIRDITEKILAYQEKRPEKAEQLRRFLGYYLPTTLKILRSYANLEEQGVSGENITGAMERVERMMDTVTEGFERQLDQLYQGETMDITADVEVLERMMAQDGLTIDPETATWS